MSIVAFQAEKLLRQKIESRLGIHILAGNTKKTQDKILSKIETGDLEVDAILLGKTIPNQTRIRERIHNVDRNISVVWLYGRKNLERVIEKAIQDTKTRRRHDRIINRNNFKRTDISNFPFDSKRYLDRLLDLVPIGILLIDFYKHVIECNTQAATLLGRPPQEIIGSDLASVFPKTERVALRKFLETMISRGMTDKKIFRLEANGGKKFVEITASQIVGATGGRGSLILLQDVTDRLQIEREREEALFLYSQLLTREEEAHKKLQTTNEALRLKIWQQAVIAELGKHSLVKEGIEELMNEAVAIVKETLSVEFVGILELLPGGRELRVIEGRGWRKGIVGKARVTALPVSLPGYTLHAQKHIIMEDLRSEKRFPEVGFLHSHSVRSGACVIIREEENPYGVLVAADRQARKFSLEDINFLQAVANVLASAIIRIKFEEELRASRNQLEGILQGVADGIIVQDRERNVIFINQTAAVMSGFSSARELLGRPFRALFKNIEIRDEDETMVPYSQLPCIRVLHGERLPEKVVRFVLKKKGKEQWLKIRGRALYDENEKVLFAIGIFQDVTEEKIEEKRRDHFIGIASHELKTPLTGIKAFTQLLQKRLSNGRHDPKLAEYLQKIDTQVTKQTQLINDLLDVTRIRAGRLELHMEVFDFDELVRESADMIHAMYPSHKIAIHGKTRKLILSDKGRIGQVLANLLTNAIKYSPLARRILIRLEAESERVMVSVQDFGIGIPRKKQKQIFDPYFRADSPKDRFTGLGLGLHITHEIIKRSGGEIEVKSAPKKGSTFSFWLPVKPQSNSFHKKPVATQ